MKAADTDPDDDVPDVQDEGPATQEGDEVVRPG